MASDLTPDWILKSVLSVQSQAHADWLRSEHPELRADDGGLTLTVLGCGTMGLAILSGILSSLQQPQYDQNFTQQTLASGVRVESLPDRVPTRFHACVRRKESVQRVKKEVDKYDADVTLFVDDNVTSVRQSDVILLCCKSASVQDILRTEGMRQALANKLLISICAGVTETQLYTILYDDPTKEADKCVVVRAMANVAAAVRESMTVIAVSDPPPPDEKTRLVDWIFQRVGRIVHLPAHMMNASTALCGSGPGFVAVMVESMATSAISLGIPREQAYTMVAQTMRGCTGILLEGEHPAVLRDRVSTPAGATTTGLQVLEEAAIRETIAKSLRTATKTASDAEADMEDCVMKHKSPKTT